MEYMGELEQQVVTNPEVIRPQVTWAMRPVASKQLNDAIRGLSAASKYLQAARGRLLLYQKIPHHDLLEEAKYYVEKAKTIIAAAT